KGLRVLIIDTGIEKRIEETHKKCNLIPFSFHLNPKKNRLYFKNYYKNYRKNVIKWNENIGF
ncbi:MAG TPA: hypothetical protein PLJ57_07970, partial [Tepidanaerobacteraceae bacterium]|nr:hypothetical protein [Tepidanaerobacteraceae bacterium]